MDLVGTDPDLGPKPELAAVVEPGAGVDDHGGAVHFIGESLGGDEIVRDYRVGVAGAVPGDMVDRLVDRLDDRNGQN